MDAGEREHARHSCRVIERACARTRVCMWETEGERGGERLRERERERERERIGEEIEREIVGGAADLPTTAGHTYRVLVWLI